MADVEHNGVSQKPVNDEKASISHAEGINASPTASIGADLKAEKTVDTVHMDEAMKVLANYQGDETWTPAEEKQVQRIIDWRLMPCLCATYCLQYYDKAMLGQAVSCPPFIELPPFIRGRSISLSHQIHLLTIW
jgi:hypothetical protein